MRRRAPRRVVAPGDARGETVTATDAVSPRLLASVGQIEDIILSWAERIAGYDVYRARRRRGPTTNLSAVVGAAWVRVLLHGRRRLVLHGAPSSGRDRRARVRTRVRRRARRHRARLASPRRRASGGRRARAPARRRAHGSSGILRSLLELGPLSRRRASRASRTSSQRASRRSSSPRPRRTRFSRRSARIRSSTPDGARKTSSSCTTGCEASRLDKLDVVAREPAARHSLRVCWENRGGAYNCGRCEKCLRTMVAMDALGVLDAVRPLPPPDLDVRHRQGAAPRRPVHVGGEPGDARGHRARSRRRARRAPAALRSDDACGPPSGLLRPPPARTRARVTASRRARRRADAYFGDPDTLASRERILSERIRKLTVRSSPRLPDGGLVWPLAGRITSRFGDRLGRFHPGIDVAAPEGTPVVAVAAGRVVIAETLSDLGNSIVLDHDNGCATVYAASPLAARRGR